MKQKKGLMFTHISLALSAALFGALALPNEIFLEGLWPLGFIAIIPLYIALIHVRSFKEAAIICGLFGGMHHATTSYWLFFYKDFAFWTLGSTTLAYSIIYAFAGTVAYYAVTRSGRSLRPFLFALGWVTFEYFKSIGFLGYPWGLISYSQTTVPLLLQTADIMGVYGLSFALALCSAVGGEWILAGLFHRNQSALKNQGNAYRILKHQSSIFLLILSIYLLYGLFSLQRNIPVEKTFKAVLVQQNTDPWTAGEQAALKANISMARQALLHTEGKLDNPDNPDLVIFSETSLRRPYDEFKSWFEINPQSDPLIPFIKESGSYLLTGAPEVLDWELYTATNSVILISPEGKLLESYAKIHPVPFAEAIPFWDYEWFRTFMQEVIGLDSGWAMGTKRTVFRFFPPSLEGEESIAFSTPICFEDAFADLCREYILNGADLLINLTNDSWSRKKSAQIQHWAIARFRAIENRRTLVRSTNSGVSSVVDAKGIAFFLLPQFEAASSIVDVPVYKMDKYTIYTLYGDWFAQFCSLLFVIGLIILQRSDRVLKSIQE